MQQIKDLDISAMDDMNDTTSTVDNPYRSQQIPARAGGANPLNRSNRQSFMNFGTQGGKKSPINRAHINRMTQNLVANRQSYLNRRSTMMEQVKQPVPVRDMWKPKEQTNAGKDDDDDEDGKKKKKAERAWFKTTVKFEKDMEVFETEELGSDEDDSEKSDDDDS